jgi:hypothetical protein
MVLELPFYLGYRVRIKELDRPAVIHGIGIDHQGIRYWVAYWADFKRGAEWVYEDEIEVMI